MTQALQFVALPWSWQLQFDREENCWVATIDELPDFFAAGASAGEAAANARDALISHLTGYLQTGTPIPTPTAKTARPVSGVKDAGDLVECAV
jgi:predicted RNase H-like HicB family nuclease